MTMDRETENLVNVSELSPKKKKFKMPHIYVILISFIIIAAITTYIIPAGVYERVAGPEGRTTIDPTSYERVDGTPVGIIGLMTAIPRGLMAAGEVIFFTFMIGGVFAVIRKTGLIEIGVDRLTRTFASKNIVLIPILMIVFSIICTIIGTQELSLVYIPVILPLMIALGYDSVVAVGIALIATTAGFMTGVLNPVNTGLGQKLSDLPVFSGMGLRTIAFVLFVAVGIFYVMRYAQKVKKNSTLSYVYKEDTVKREMYLHTKLSEKKIATKRQKIASIALLSCFIVLIYGVLVKG